MADRCDAFLRSGLEYKWPPFPELDWVQLAQGIIVALGCLVVAITVILMLLTLSTGAWIEPGVIAMIGGLTMLPGWWGYRWLSQFVQRRFAAYWGCGPRDLWPFFSAAEYERACRDHADLGASRDSEV